MFKDFEDFLKQLKPQPKPSFFGALISPKKNPQPAPVSTLVSDIAIPEAFWASENVMPRLYEFLSSKAASFTESTDNPWNKIVNMLGLPKQPIKLTKTQIQVLLDMDDPENDPHMIKLNWFISLLDETFFTAKSKGGIEHYPPLQKFLAYLPTLMGKPAYIADFDKIFSSLDRLKVLTNTNVGTIFGLFEKNHNYLWAILELFSVLEHRQIKQVTKLSNLFNVRLLQFVVDLDDPGNLSWEILNKIAIGALNDKPLNNIIIEPKSATVKVESRELSLDLLQELAKETAETCATDATLAQFFDTYPSAILAEKAITADEIVVIGDTHGCIGNLLGLLNGWVQNYPRAHLLCLGDYLDRGGYGREVITLLLKLKEKYPAKITLLRGNHEQSVIDYRSMYEDVYSFVSDSRFNLGLIGIIYRLPIAVDVKVTGKGTFLAVHAGISFAELDKLESRRFTSVNIDNALWSDLCTWSTQTQEGYFNDGRGVGYYCGPQAAIILKSKGYVGLLRGHEHSRWLESDESFVHTIISGYLEGYKNIPDALFVSSKQEYLRFRCDNSPGFQEIIDQMTRNKERRKELNDIITDIGFQFVSRDSLSSECTAKTLQICVDLTEKDFFDFMHGAIDNTKYRLRSGVNVDEQQIIQKEAKLYAWFYNAYFLINGGSHATFRTNWDCLHDVVIKLNTAMNFKSIEDIQKVIADIMDFKSPASPQLALKTALHIIFSTHPEYILQENDWQRLINLLQLQGNTLGEPANSVIREVLLAKSTEYLMSVTESVQSAPAPVEHGYSATAAPTEVAAPVIMTFNKYIYRLTKNELIANQEFISNYSKKLGVCGILQVVEDLNKGILSIGEINSNINKSQEVNEAFVRTELDKLGISSEDLKQYTNDLMLFGSYLCVRGILNIKFPQDKQNYGLSASSHSRANISRTPEGKIVFDCETAIILSNNQYGAGKKERVAVISNRNQDGLSKEVNIGSIRYCFQLNANDRELVGEVECSNYLIKALALSSFTDLPCNKDFNFDAMISLAQNEEALLQQVKLHPFDPVLVQAKETLLQSFEKCFVKDVHNIIPQWLSQEGHESLMLSQTCARSPKFFSPTANLVEMQSEDLKLIKNDLWELLGKHDENLLLPWDEFWLLLNKGNLLQFTRDEFLQLLETRDELLQFLESIDENLKNGIEVKVLELIINRFYCCLKFPEHYTVDNIYPVFELLFYAAAGRIITNKVPEKLSKLNNIWDGDVTGFQCKVVSLYAVTHFLSKKADAQQLSISAPTSSSCGLIQNVQESTSAPSSLPSPFFT